MQSQLQPQLQQCRQPEPDVKGGGVVDHVRSTSYQNQHSHHHQDQVVMQNYPVLNHQQHNQNCMGEGVSDNTLVGPSLASQNFVHIDAAPMDPDPGSGIGSPSIWPLTSTELEDYNPVCLWDYNDPFFLDF